MQQTEWSPNPVAIGACALGGIVIGVTAVTLVTDAPGRFLWGVAAVGLLIFAGLEFRARPKLAITADGLAIRGLWHSKVLAQSQIERIRITEIARAARSA